MSVYVDDMARRMGRMLMYHMVADTSAELLAMAKKLGVSHKWIQHAGTHKEHFDICLAKRRLAVERGAIEITWRQCGDIIRERRLKLEEARELLEVVECRS